MPVRFDTFTPLLWGLPLMLLLWGLRRWGPRPAALRFPSVALLGHYKGLLPGLSVLLLPVLRFLGLGCLLLAWMRPYQDKGYTEADASGIDMVLAVDLSGSMIAHDFEVAGEPASRLDVVKKVLNEFIQRRKSDRIGLVVFAKESFLASPLTANRQHLEKIIQQLQIGVIDERATAIGLAMGMSVNSLRNLDAPTKVVILLTDGENNSGKVSPVVAAQAAAQEGVKFYTIAAGTEGVVPIPVMVNGAYLRDSRGQILYNQAQMSVDEKTLKEVSQITGGEFFRATDTASLQRIYTEIDRLEKREVKVYHYARYQEWFWVPLSLALMLLFLEQLLGATVLRRLP